MFNKYPYTDFHEMNLDWFLKKFKELLTYYNELDTTIQNKINAILNQWLIDGTISQAVVSDLSKIMSEIENVKTVNNEQSSNISNLQTNVATNITDINTLNTRVDTFTNLPNGSTTGDAELIDGRIDYTGRTFTNIGTSIRTNERGVTSILDVILSYIGGTLPTLIPNSYVSTSGDIHDYSGWVRTDYIEINSSKPLFIYATGTNDNNPYNAFYDVNKNFISNFYVSNGLNNRTPPKNAKYIILSAPYTFTCIISESNKNNSIFDVINRSTYKHDYNNLFPLTDWNLGTYTTNINTRIHSTKVEAWGGGHYQITYMNDNYRVAVNSYDENGDLIYEGGYLNHLSNVILDNRTRYISFLVCRTDDTSIQPDDMLSAGISFKLKHTPSLNCDRLKIMSFNVGGFHYGTGTSIPDDIYTEKVKNWKSFIMSTKVDVLSIQEFYDWLNSGHTVSTFTLFDPIFKYVVRGWQNVIEYSKYPLIEYVDGDYLGDDDNTKRGYTISHIIVNGKKIAIANVHLYYDESAIDVRKAQINKLITLLSSEKYVIITGDFNVANKSEYQPFIDAGYILSNGGYLDFTSTWPANPNQSVSHEWYTDNIMVSSNIVVENVTIPDTYDLLTSDHKPIIAELIIL